jgi:drug/metabolite transporter (DMT)-like permease
MVAVVAGHLVLGEPWSFQLLIGGLITLLGVYLVKRGYNKGIS